MQLTSTSLTDGARIPGEFAFAVPDEAAHVALSANRNPHLRWTDVPEGTESFVIVCHDPDAPANPAGANTEGEVIAADRPRADFFHWLLVDIPADVREIAEGTHAEGIAARGKAGPETVQGMRHGANDYTHWFAGDADMEGTYFGYDGPCPPWNDAIAHRYLFTVYALGSRSLPVDGAFEGAAVTEALASAHVLASASISGWYSLNPDVIAAASRA